MSEMIFNESLSWTMEQEFNDALRNKKATAWVTDNDSTAVAALEYLDRVGVEVPRRLSIAAFDNTVDAQTAGLTSYDFNLAARGQSCVSFILASQDTRKRWDRFISSIEGLVIPRRSTAQPRGGKARVSPSGVM